LGCMNPRSSSVSNSHTSLLVAWMRAMVFLQGSLRVVEDRKYRGQGG
jgi:hypothetical protein